MRVRACVHASAHVCVFERVSVCVNAITCTRLGLCVVHTNRRVDRHVGRVLHDVSVHTLCLAAAAHGDAVSLRVASVPLNAEPVGVVEQAATIQLKCSYAISQTLWAAFCA